MLARLGTLCLFTIVTLVSCPCLADDEAPLVSYENHKVVRAYPRSWEQIEQIHDLGALLLTDSEGIGPVDYVFPPEAMAALDAMDIRYEVLNDNLQETIDAERKRLENIQRVGPRDPTWFQDYKTYDQIVAKLNAMVNDRPDLCTLIDIGDSIEGRDIWALHITGPGSDKPAVLFNGVQHAREWIAVMVPMYIADRLVYQYNFNPAIQSLVDRVEFIIVPVVNPDGYVYSWTSNRLWRKNRRDNPGTSCDGVDLNRNWGAGWGGSGSSGDPCDNLYRGPSAFSEPETQTLRDYFIANPRVVSNIDFHSYSQLILSPFGYTSTLPADNDLFLELGEAMHDLILGVHGVQYDWGPIYSTIYPASGGSVDWCYEDQGVFSFTIELRDTGYYGFELPPEQIIPNCEEILPAALHLAEWSSNPLFINFPNGLPSRLDPGVPETVLVRISEIGATLDPTSPRIYTRIGDTGNFTETPLTPLVNTDYQATLPATPCGRTLEYYFAVDTTGGQTVLSPADAPAILHEVTAAPIVLAYDVDMSQNPGWTTQGLWAWGQPTGGGGEYGGPDPSSGHTGQNVYGYNLYGDYENQLPERHLTSTTFDCSNVTGVTLSFWRWLGVEQPAYDHAYVRVCNNGLTWNTIWQNTSEITDNQWVYQEFDISAYADGQSAVQLRWTMGSTDSGWRYCGWNIDDVQVWAADPNGCPQLLGDLDCDGDVDFDDINPFVLALAGEAGYYAEHPDCNWLNADCDEDGDVDFDDINPFVDLIGQ